jgi:hypothetical protein
MADGQQHREVASLDYFQFQDFETEALIRIQDDEIISIAPFASRQLRVLFHAQVRTTILVIVAATLSNPR